MHNPVTKNIILGYIHTSNSISYNPIEGTFLRAKFVKIKILNGNKNRMTTLVVKLFPNSQALLNNNALINLSPHLQIQNPLNHQDQVFLHLSLSYNFLMLL